MSDHGRDAHIDVHGTAGGGALRYIPYFLLVFVLYLLGAAIKDPRAAFIALGAYKLSWVEILLILAAVLSLLEQMKVSHPGIDNTWEALTMVGMGVLQLVLWVLGAAKVGIFSVFSTSEFLELTFISLAAAIVAVLINARTLRRTIGVGDN